MLDEEQYDEEVVEEEEEYEEEGVSVRERPLSVWCGDWSISLPEKIEALRGSCVTINCTFDINNTYDKDLTDSAAGVWLKDEHKDNNNIVFNSSNFNLSFKGKITGKLKDKNCTTTFYDVTSNHGGTFYFRIEGNGGLKWTYEPKCVSIAVIDSPPNPTVQMFKDQMKVEVHEEVLEGSSMCLRCSAKTLCSSSPPTLTWSSTDRLHLNESSRLQLDQQNQTEIISDLNFTATHLQHRVTFICTITYQLQQRITTAQSNITLRVQYAPKKTSVSVFPSNSVLEGSSVTLICSSDGNPAVFNYTWYRENGGQLEELQTGSNLTFNVTDRTHTGRYFCQSRNQHGTQNTSVLLDIQYASKISFFSCNRTDVTVCLCEAHGNPSPKVEWFLSGRPVSNSTNTFISEERLSSTDLRSFISLHQSLTHTDTLQCVTINTHGTASEKIQLFCSPQETTGFSLFSVLIGAAIGATIMIILCVITHLCKRKDNRRSLKARDEDISGLDLSDRENEEPVYANKSKEETSLNYPQSLHYSSIDFTNTQTESEEIRGVSSLTAVYADVRHYSEQEEAKSSVGNVEPLHNSNISTVEIADSETRDLEFTISTDIEQDQSKKTDLQSDEVYDLYAQVKRCHPKN
ncbi:sialic acid-binding Ig-like lectin 14 [Paramisgurnus dabryanus]|uniref:sialic acid-binding Ig-like lectin 14 n=1 Tax=Paramisgurnus dabryanus TaxID=90735 RepID=UPI003CCFD488